MRVLLVIANVIGGLVLVLVLGDAISFTSRGSFNFAEAALAGAKWSQAATFAVILLIGTVAYGNTARREDASLLIQEIKELQRRVDKLQPAVQSATVSPAVAALPPQPSKVRPKIPDRGDVLARRDGDTIYRGIGYTLNQNYSVSAVIQGKQETWPSLADFRAWVDEWLG